MKSHFPVVSLGSHVQQISQRNKGESGMEVFSVTNSEGFTLSTDYFSKEVFSKDVSNYKVVRKGQFAYNPSRINVGSIDYLKSADKVLVSPLYIVFEADSELYADYLLRYMKSAWGNAQIRANTEGAVRDSLKYKGLENIKIPLPPIDKQKRIAYLLSKVEGGIAQRKQHLQQLDDLLKSFFLEMFGDPGQNKKGWDKKPLQDLCRSPKDIKCGPFGTQLNKDEFQKNGVPVWGIPQINSEFAIPPNDFVTTEKAAELDDYSVIYNDIVMSRKGTVGKCSIYPEFLAPGIMHSDVLRIRADWGKTNPIYLCWQLRISRDVERQIANVSSGAIMAGINVGKLKAISVYAPPIGLQNQFATIVEKIESIKSLYQRSLTDLEKLYSALSQKAFKGELDLSRVPLTPGSTESTAAENPETNEPPQTTNTFELPAPENPAILNSSDGRNALLDKWLTVWLEHLNNVPFSAQPFMEAAQQRLWELAEEPEEVAEALGAVELGAAEYDHLKTWVFESLKSGRLAQTYDDANNRVLIKAVRN